jgi:hypothetical protein
MTRRALRLIPTLVMRTMLLECEAALHVWPGEFTERLNRADDRFLTAWIGTLRAELVRQELAGGGRKVGRRAG